MGAVAPGALSPAFVSAQASIVLAGRPQVQGVAAFKLKALRPPSRLSRLDLVDHVPTQVRRDRLDLLVALASVELRGAANVPTRGRLADRRSVGENIAETGAGEAEARVCIQFIEDSLEVHRTELEIGIELGEYVKVLIELCDAPLERPELGCAREAIRLWRARWTSRARRLLVGVGESNRQLTRAVGRAVVDQHQSIGKMRLALDRTQQAREIAGPVPERNDDRQLH